MSARPVAVRTAVVAAAALLLLAGCSPKPATPPTPRVVDSQQVENALVMAQKEKTPDLDVRDPSCPARVVVSEGATFPCTLALEGVIVPYTVTLSNVATRIEYNIAPAKAILLMPKLVQALQDNAPGTRIDCGPDRIKVLDVGATLACTLTDSKGAHPVTLKVTDVQGDVTQVAAP